MSIYKQLNVRHFEGREIDKPIKLVFGDRFMATDTGNIYIANESGAMEIQNLIYNKYVALLNQVVVADPTAIVLENNIGVSPVWTRTAIGVYTTAFAGDVSEKMFLSISNSASVADSEIRIKAVYNGTTETVVTIYTEGAGIPADVILLNTSLEIRIYQ